MWVMKIIGIDPGTAIMGFGILDVEGQNLSVITYGAIRTFPEKTTAERLLDIHQGLEELMRKYKPDCMSVEQLFFNRNITTAMTVGQARGVALLTAAEAGIPVHEYTPLQVKQSVTGEGRADKHQVGYMVRLLLHLDEIPRPDDVADALAIAICHAHTCGTKRKLEISWR